MHGHAAVQVIAPLVVVERCMSVGLKKVRKGFSGFCINWNCLADPFIPGGSLCVGNIFSCLCVLYGKPASDVVHGFRVFRTVDNQRPGGVC